MTLEELKARGEQLRKQHADCLQMFHQFSGQIAENEIMQQKMMEELAKTDNSQE